MALAQIEEQSIKQINDALGGIQKNMATKKEVTDLIDQKVAELEEARKAAEETPYKNAIEELKSQNDMLKADLATLKRTRFAAVKDSNNNYNGVWDSWQQARDFGMVVLAEVAGNKNAREYCKANGIDSVRLKTMGEDANSTGGALVPTEFIPNLIVLQEAYGAFRRNAQEIPMPSDSAIAPKLTSGLTVYCPGAGTAITQSDLAFGTVGLTAKKWATLTGIDSELDEDSAIAVGELVGRQIARAFAKKEDEVGFLGDGTSTYFGHTGIIGAIKNVTSNAGIVAGAGTAYTDLTLANFETLLGTVPEYADDGMDLKFYCSRLFYYTAMVRVALASGGANALEVQMNRMRRQKEFLGYPVELTPALPKAAAASQYCCVFGNLRMGAYLGDARKTTIARSEHAGFSQDIVMIRGTQRVAPTIVEPGTSSDAGPICVLQLAAS